MSATATSTLFQVVRRNGGLVPFDSEKIRLALTKAFMAVAAHGELAPATRHQIQQLTEAATQAVQRNRQPGDKIFIEDIQDHVELALMRAEAHAVARAYVLYREERARERQARSQQAEDPHTALRAQLRQRLSPLCADLPGVAPAELAETALLNLFPGASDRDVNQALIMSARDRFEQDPVFDKVAARLLRANMVDEVAAALSQPAPADSYAPLFRAYLQAGVAAGLIHAELLDFDLARLEAALEPSADARFGYLGLQTLYDRYLLHRGGTRFELPQFFFMRVAMGLALREPEREARAEAFYRLLAEMRFMCSTPTLFNSGTTRPQLSSCFLTTIPDDLGGIYSAIRDNALLAKYAGGIGNDWTPIRGLGAAIRGTNGKSMGVVPFMKVANDTAVAVNQGGKRKGAVCAYLECWHIDFEEFTELRKNTGDDRRRTHDMNTAAWVPDLFMKRLEDDADWTLFSPDECRDLHELWSQAFERRYLELEAAADRGELAVWKRLPAQRLWRKLLTMLFETGHPWITFKDACNARSPQAHVGVVHGSNLCTEITLNTSEDEVAVCNLGSVNLAAHLGADGLDLTALRATVHLAMRMLDNVIDINFYTVPQARRANLRHRPVGLGLMGFQDALYRLGLPYACEAAMQFADRSAEALAYYAIEASAELARERGNYPSFQGSLWHQGILPLDSLARLEHERARPLELDRARSLDWDSLREIVRGGMRNSNCLAIAPTATISNICGVSQSIEPTYRNLFVKSNMSGDFTLLNEHLVAALEARGLWDPMMASDLKYSDGRLENLARVPDELKRLFATAFEIEPHWLIEAAARRQKWLDQAQSLNLYLERPSGRELDQMYRLAWRKGLKTTYYLRTLGATHAEKVTVQSTALNAVCSIDNPDCEACQ